MTADTVLMLISPGVAIPALPIRSSRILPPPVLELSLPVPGVVILL